PLARVCTDEAPLPEVLDALIDQHGPVVSRISRNQVDVRYEKPNWSFHGEVQCDQEDHQEPSKGAHFRSHRPKTESNERRDVAKKRCARGRGQYHYRGSGKTQSSGQLCLAALPQPPKKWHERCAKDSCQNGMGKSAARSDRPFPHFRRYRLHSQK